jgi:hypothetical protein
MRQLSPRINIFDNLFVVLFFIFFPFTYALTFKLGFPLKISEIALFIILTFILLRLKFKVSILHTAEFGVVTLFMLLAFLSLAVNLAWTYEYKLSVQYTRFGVIPDSILKFFYIGLAFISFIVAANAFSANPQKYIRYWMIGAIIASIYAWYLAVFSLFKLPVVFLPGMDDIPQTIKLPIGEYIRSGTFKEGNYMGMFLLLSGAIAFYTKRIKTGFFFYATILTTASTVGFVTFTTFIVMYYSGILFTRRNLIKFLIFLPFLALILTIALQNENIYRFTVAKITGDTSVDRGIDYSKNDRLNSIEVGFKTAFENPVLGVGPANYSLHYNYFNLNKDFDHQFKNIPNNVYAEIASELGFPALILFLLFGYLLVKRSNQYKDKTLRNGVVLSFVYLFTFPTFILLFVWAFWGLVVSLPEHYEDFH